MVKIEKTKTLNEEKKWKTTKLIVFLHIIPSDHHYFDAAQVSFLFYEIFFYHWEEHKFFEGVWQVCFLMTQQAPLFWGAFGFLQFL